MPSQISPPSLCLKSWPAETAKTGTERVSRGGFSQEVDVILLLEKLAPQDSRTDGFAKANGSGGRRTPEHGGMVSSSDQARSCARSIGKPSMMNVPPPCWNPAHTEAVPHADQERKVKTRPCRTGPNQTSCADQRAEDSRGSRGKRAG